MSTPRDTGKIFEELKAVIQDLNGRLGTVANVNGVVSNAILERAAPTDSTWYVATTKAARGEKLLADVANAIAYEQPGYSPIISTNGEIRFTPPEDDATKTHLFLTNAKIQGPTSFPVTVDATGYDVSVYVGKRRVVSGRGKVSVSPTLELGDTTIFIIASGGTGRITITSPERIETNAKIPTPGVPSWTSSGTSEYLNNESGSLVIDLHWANDPYAGSWSVYRASGTLVGTPDSVSDLGGKVYRLTWTGLNLTGSLRQGLVLYTDEWEAGTISSVTFTGGDTLVDIILEEGAPTSVPQWEVAVFKKEGQYTARTRLGYDFATTITWRDTDVRSNNLYFYKVTAHDFLSGSAESDFSPPLRIYPGKGPINLSVPTHAWLPKATVAGEGNRWLEITIVPELGTRSVHIRAVGTDLSGAFDVAYDLNFSTYGASTTHIIKVDAWDGSPGNEYNKYWDENSPSNTIYLTPYDELNGQAGVGTPGNTYELIISSVPDTAANINAYEQMFSGEVDGAADFLTIWDTDESETKKITVADFVLASGVIPENLADMQDVDLNTVPPILDDLLQFDGGSWVPVALSAGSIAGLSAAIDDRLDNTQTIAGAWTFTPDVRFNAYLELLQHTPGDDPTVGYTGLWSTGDNLKFQDGVGSTRTVLHDGNSTVATFTITDLLTMSPAVSTTFITWGGGGVHKLTNQGGALFFADSSVWLHAGDSATTHASNAGITPTTTTETMYLTADGDVVLLSGLQAGYGARNEWRFAANGDITLPTGSITESGEMTGFNWTGDVIQELYGGTGIGGSSILQGDLMYANVDGNWQRLPWIGSGRYLRSIGGAGTEAIEWSVGISASDIGNGTFSGAFSFSAGSSVKMDMSDGLWLDILGATPSTIDVGYTSIYSLGDHLGYQTSGGATRTVVHTDGGQTLAGNITATRFVASVDGTAVLPAIRRSTDSNTGMYWSAPDTLAWSTGGTNRMTLTSAGVLQVTGDVEFNTSDVNLKDILGNLSDPIGSFKKLGKGFLYNWNALGRASGHLSDRVRVGLSAQKVREALPQAVYEDDKGYLGYHPEMLDALIVTVLQEVLERMEALENV